MPCRDGGPDITSVLSTRLNLVTRVACELARNIKDKAKLTRKTQNWIAEHNKIDNERKEEARRMRERQKISCTALAKLTVEEREVLGLK